MSISISGMSAVQPTPVEPAVVPASPAEPSHIATPAAQTSDDSVRISLSAQVNQLSMQGENMSSIAEKLEVSPNLVEVDLGIAAQAAAIPFAGLPAHGAGPEGAPAALPPSVTKSTLA